MNNADNSNREWSSYQQAIFGDVANGYGHTVVNAVAGSGKTTTLQYAVPHIPRGKRSMFVAFNTSIKDELKRRLDGQPVDVSTLHGYGLRTVTKSLGRLEIDEYRVPNMCERLYGKDKDTSDLRYDVAKIVSLAKGSLASGPEDIDDLIEEFGVESIADEVDEEDGPGLVSRKKFIEDVLKILHQCTGTEDGKLDFDDMVWLPVVLDLRQFQFDRIIGDEIQDFNAAQIELMMRAVRGNGRFLGVGDPHQAIYRFRGAGEDSFGNVRDRLKAKELELSVSYRCCRSVVREAQKIVPQIQAAPDAVEGEVTSVGYEAMKAGARPGDFIISRTNAPIIGLCLSFLKDGRRANIQGRDIGKSLKAFIRKSKAKSIVALRDYTEAWKEEECARLAAKHRDTKSVEDRAACIMALSEGVPEVDDVLANIDALFADKDDKSQIVLSTTHKAKGLERDRVWLLRSTYLRSNDTEERNLLYVAVTRAKKQLFLARDE